MTQFASTLYPQTNPSNPILLHLRSAVEVDSLPVPAYVIYRYWLDCIDKGYTPGREVHLEHARLVLTRLVSLTG